MSSVLTTKLDFWIKHSKNVLFVGKHGVGKTNMVAEAFNRHKLNWRYFSASTMDPWVDFVGVPKERTDNKLPEQFEIIKELASINLELAYEWVQSNWKLSDSSAKQVVDHALNRKNGLTYLDLVRPQTFAAGEVEALFFDEYNRSPKKVRNAVMELIQFKSINGMKFPNLKMVWAAINPDDDEDDTYDVERLDPAQADRYHVTVLVPYKPNAMWFRSEYGNQMADAAIQWWDDLSKEEKNKISPRRLQYALDVYRERGDMKDILPLTSNVSKLITALNTGPIGDKLEALMKKDPSHARTFLQNENNYSSSMKLIKESKTLMNYFLPLLPKEKMSSLMSENDLICNYIIENSDKVPAFKTVCKEIMGANTNIRLVKKIRRAATINNELAVNFATDDVNEELLKPDPAHFNKLKTLGKKTKSWGDTLNLLVSSPKDTSQQRIQIYDTIASNIPEKQTGDEALLVLEILDHLCFIHFSTHFSSNITTKPFEKLIGIVNHCFETIHENTGEDFKNILKNHGNHFIHLLEKIKEGGLMCKINTELK